VLSVVRLLIVSSCGVSFFCCVITHQIKKIYIKTRKANLQTRILCPYKNLIVKIFSHHKKNVVYKKKIVI